MTQAPASPETGPFLTAALICEKVLDERDGVKSLIRLIDRLLIQAAGTEVPDQMPPFEQDFTMFLSFKAGSATGPVGVRVTLTSPSGMEEKQRPAFDQSVHFEGGTRGHNLIIRSRIRFTEAGPYWFNIYVGGRLVTRTPYEVVYTFRRTGGTLPPGQAT